MIWLDDKGIQRRGLDNTSHWRTFEMLLLILASLGVFVLEDEVYLERRLLDLLRT